MQLLRTSVSTAVPEPNFYQLTQQLPKHDSSRTDLLYVIIAGAGNYTMTLNSAFSCYVFAIDRSQAAKTLTGSYTITQTALSIPVSGVTTVTITNTKFSMAAGVFITDYLVLTGSTANGGATFYAGSHATNVSGNSGWLFQDFTGIYPLQHRYRYLRDRFRRGT